MPGAPVRRAPYTPLSPTGGAAPPFGSARAGPPPRAMSPRIAAPLLVALLLAAGPGWAQEAAVRVRVLSREAPADLTVEAEAAPLAVAVDGRPVGTLAPGARLQIVRRGREVEVWGAGLSGRGGAVRVDGGVRLRAGRTDRRYVGVLEASAADGPFEVVSVVPLEAYVSSVVASEYPFPEVEGAKAQAVLARTYALRRTGAQARYDLDDHTGSQVYRGAGAETEVSRRAAAETAGEVLRYDGALAETPYFSSSGGYTADNDAVWAGAPLPYLRAVADPYDADSPHHTWETTVGQDRLHRALSDRFGGRVRGFTVARRSRSGRVAEVTLDGARRPSISGSQFRSAVNAELGAQTIRSTRFEVARDGDAYVFTGGGFGHGVGMSQYGARGQARAGRSYRDILAYYFAGTALDGGAGGPYLALDRPAPGSAPTYAPAPPRPEVGGVVVRRRPTPRRDARAAERPKRRVAW